MTAALSIEAAPIDLATVAPEDWWFLGDLVATVLPAAPAPRPSGIRLREADDEDHRAHEALRRAHLAARVTWAHKPPPARSRGSAPKWSDCGNVACPDARCRKRIAARVEAAHRRAVARPPRSAAPRAWISVLAAFGGPARTTTGDAWSVHGRSYVRPSRAKEQEPKPRITALLSSEERTAALALLDAMPTRRRFDRREWLNETWLEIENPREGTKIPDDLGERVKQAAWRAEARLRKFGPENSLESEV